MEEDGIFSGRRRERERTDNMITTRKISERKGEESTLEELRKTDLILS